MRNSGKFFKLYASCLPVLGANRSTICDVERNKLHFIPNILCEILVEHATKSIEEIKQFYNNEADDIIDEYFDFLIEHELIFFTEEPDLFPPLDLTWKSPSIITNALIDVDSKSEHDFAKIFKELDEFNCKALEIRFFEEIPISKVNQILTICKYGRLSSIDLLLKYSDETQEQKLEQLSNTYKKVTSITIHTAPEKNQYSFQTGSMATNILFTTQNINSSNHCGVVSTHYFSTNQEFFLESQKHNSCLNRKISIDIRGDIKNCPSMSKSYGNINNTSLSEALQKDGFKKYWTITKDQIDICKDCEFRHVCTDCRAYTNDPNSLFSKPLKCGYDPYTNEWKKWSMNPLKHKSIEKHSLVNL
ncbi:grasp-with-spasm system SPASM domain peptide maturase [Aquimarina sp. AU58]|uniref:grasp-with-spasm system SPASM domain peptide maturase n=1 Tax=Aquimarina sp. AU58 TaxID=1874112 RepID=UPI000D6E764C|nr:grasp-with-spasm system SPASM domain peptide maturase [Aquimarina sp. AU58]